MAQTKINGSNISQTTQALIDQLQFNSTGSILTLPSGTTAQRPTGVSLGTIRFNTTKDGAEIYNTQTGTADWNGIGSETGIDGGNAFIRTNGTTITKNITIGPIANSDQKYTYGLLIGDITIANGITVDIEDGSILAIHDEQTDGFTDFGGGSGSSSFTFGQIVNQTSFSSVNRFVTSASSNATIDTFKFTKKQTNTILVVQASVSAFGNDNDGNYYYVDIDGTKNYTGFGESPYVEYYGIYVTQYWSGIAAGAHTLSWGWQPIDGSSNRPFNVQNVNALNDGRNRQNGSEFVIWEVDPGALGSSTTTTPIDSNYFRTSLLLHFNSSLKDDSNINAQISSGGAFTFATSPTSPVGNSTVANFVATSGTYTRVVVPDNYGLRFGTGDFTIEGWIYINSNDSGLSGYNRRIFQKGSNSTSGYCLLYDASNVYFGRTDEQILTNARSNWNGGWHHFAIVRDSGTFRMYRDGVQVSNSTTGGSTDLNNLDPLYLGVYPADPTATASNHYLSDFRITSGICRYPSGTTFTVSTTPFGNQASNTLGTKSNPAKTASQLVSAGYTVDGVYFLSPEGSKTPFQAYVDFTTLNGPWVHVGTAVGNTRGLYTYRETWASREVDSGNPIDPYHYTTSNFNAGSFMYSRGNNIMIKYSQSGYVQASGFSNESWRDVYSFLRTRTSWPSQPSYARELTITQRGGVVTSNTVSGAGLLYGINWSSNGVYTNWYVYCFDSGGDTMAYLTTGTYNSGANAQTEADHGIGANEAGPNQSSFPGNDYATDGSVAFDAGTNDATDSGSYTTYNNIPFSLWIKN